MALVTEKERDQIQTSRGLDRLDLKINLCVCFFMRERESVVFFFLNEGLGIESLQLYKNGGLLF